MNKTYGIYCVDDDYYILQMIGFQLRKYFKDSDVIIEMIEDPTETISVIERNIEHGVFPLLGIIDYQMPKINGAEVIRMMKLKFPRMKFIMVSGNSNAMQVSSLVDEDSLSHYISKPWEETDLINKVNTCLPIQLQS